jgi:hypothetical protein
VRQRLVGLVVSLCEAHSMAQHDTA